MKKLFSKMMLVALVAIAFVACEDVPAPYDMPGTGDNVPGSKTEIEGATGDGTLENPFNSVAAINEAKKLGSGNVSEQSYYIKGKVVSIATDKNGAVLNFDQGTYGNASFYISDDGTAANQFYCYRVLYLGNKKWTAGAGDVLKVGDDVIVCAKLTMYNTTPETQQNEGYLYELNGINEAQKVPDTPMPEVSNLLTNGDFETWTAGQPDHWKTASTAGNATLTQSTDAHSGSYSVSVGFNTSQNKRMGYEEITLKAGTYVFTFYAKSTTAEASQTQAGYVDVVDGKAGSYKYGGYASLTNTGWTQVSTTFTLTATTTVSLVVMNPKSSSYAVAQDILIDDASLVTADGGLAGGTTDNPDTPAAGEVKPISVAEFIAAPESNEVWYQLTGTISGLNDGDLYGNFDLTDSTGSVYVYGVLSEKGGAKKKFQELVTAHGIKNGTRITIIGNRGSYNGKIEVTNAYFVKAEN